MSGQSWWLTGWDDWLVVLWIYTFPIVVVYATIRWLLDKIKSK